MSNRQKAISFLFIFIFCYSGLRPTFPMFNYFLNFDYIAEVLCINKEKEALQCKGKCQLTKEILENESTNDSQPLQINFEKFPTLFVEKNAYTFIYFSGLNKSIPFSWNRIYKSSNKKPPFPPPQFSA